MKANYSKTFLILISIFFIIMLIACKQNTQQDDLLSSNSNKLSSLELVELMGNGINLGNTFEAYGHSSLGINADVSQYETLWGQPITTYDMMLAMKTSGFDSIRIPVAWTNAMDFENGDYTIKESYLTRVEEVINYALDADMYVIINDHWDGGWWGMFGSASQETRQKAMDMYIAMWTQIAEKYKNASYKLIFESANEELGNRLNDVDYAKDSGSLSEDDCYQTTNLINQTFVDTIRKSGGNNSERFLLIAGYNTDITKTCDDRFHMPLDQATNKLLLSVHYYTPWSYCGTNSVTSWGSEKHYNEQNSLLEMMTKYTKQGYGIIIGEYGVLPMSDGTIKENSVDFTSNFLDNCDLYGYVPMLWDTSSFFIRKDLKINDVGLSNLFSNRSLQNTSTLSLEEIQEKAKQSMAINLETAIANDKNTLPLVAISSDEALAWIMFSSIDYNIAYSVGDVYDFTSITNGVQATDAVIQGAGTYTIGLDFTNTSAGFADSCSFSAIGISNGELLFPNHIISIKEILINDQDYTIQGIPYTTSDDGICTRLNLYNGWVTAIPDEARFMNQNMKPYLSSTLLDPQTLNHIETISITFDFIPLP